jgi:hypothetical protein
VPIAVEWQDERGSTLTKYAGPPVTWPLVELAGQTTTCLRFIDPYGDTTFNRQQVPVLIHELETLDSTRSASQGPVVQALLAFLRQGQGQVHHYVKFIGD